MAQGFAATGDTVSFITLQNGAGVRTWEDIAPHYGLSTRFDLTVVPAFPEDHSVPLPYVPSVDNQLLTKWLLYHYLRGTFAEDDILYSRNPYPTYFFLVLTDALPAIGHRPRVVFEQHQIDRGMGRGFYERLDGLVVISERQCERVIERHRIDPSSTFVAHDGVDLRCYDGMTKRAARTSLDYPADEPVVAYTGHLYPSKVVETLIEAAHDIDAKCLIVGGYSEDIERIKGSMAVPAKVTFTGHVPPADVPRYQLAADVLVATIAEDRELDYFSPLKLFEYMATGNPSVVPALPEYEEVHTDGQTALLYAPESVESLTEAVSFLLDDRATASEIGRRARGQVDAYSWDRRAMRIRQWIEGERPSMESDVLASAD